MIQNILPEVEKLRKELHQIPELSFQEIKTKESLIRYLDSIPSIEVKDCGSWFYAQYSGQSPKNAIAFRADFDAVEGKDGRAGHYCGHDGHAAILAGFAKYLSLLQPERRVYLIFQPAEEIGQGALLCRSLLQTEDISEIYGFHNIPGYPSGSILLLPRTFACASTGLEITVNGLPSHAAYPEAGKNPANVMAELILLREKVLQKAHKGLVQATVIGLDLGSKAYGVSASKGSLRFTLRGELEEEFQELVHFFMEQTKLLCQEAGMECSFQTVETFPATLNHANAVAKIKKIAETLGADIIIPEEPFRWSEDFGYYLQTTPGAFFGVGAGVNHPQLHTENYQFPDEIAETVLKIYAELI